MKYTFFVLLAVALTVGAASAQQMQHQHPAGAAAPGQGMGGMMMDGHACGADCPMHGRGMMGMGMGKGMMGGGIIHLLMMNADELKLTDEQLGKLHRLMFSRMKASQDVRTKLRESKQAVHKAMMDPAADDASIRAAAKAHTDAFNAKIDASLKDRAAAMAVLTDAQKKQVKTLKPAKMPMMGNPSAGSDDTDD